MATDERQPLLQTANCPSNEHNDKGVESPENWSSAYRWSITALLAFQAFTVTFTCISVVPVAGNIVDDLSGGKGNKSGSILFVTIWELGEAAGPLLIAPLSEIYGRYPVYNAANVLFICAVAMSAWSQSVNLLIFARFLTGCAVASNVLNPAIIGDIFPEEQRGSAMSYVQLAPLLGGAIGPAVAGAIAQTTGWRMIMWMALALSIVCEIAFLMLFRETYKVVLLKKKKALLQPLDDDDETPLLKAVHETESALWASIVRPMSVFGSSFVLQMISLYGSFVFSFFYIISTTLPDILADGYGFSPSLVGSSFLTFSIGSVVGVTVCNTLLDRIYRKAKASGSTKPAPESRLPLMIVGAGLFPVVILFYGWTAQLTLPWPFMLLSVILLGFTLMLTILPMMSYVVDAFTLYSASSLTAVLISRCLMGTFLPLIMVPLDASIGYGLGFTVLAGVYAALAPITLLIWKYGGRWRQWSKYTKDE